MTQPIATPYWWEDAPLPAPAPATFPARADVAVVGAGYAGLTAALTLARAGRSVVVLDRQRPGEGGSSRNGGITSGNIRLSRTTLERWLGRAAADRIDAEGHRARRFLSAMIAEEGIDCDFCLTGRFTGAMGPRDYDDLARSAEALARAGVESFAVPQAEQHRYVGSDFYRGGSVRMDIGGLHPAKLLTGLLRLAEGAGASVIDRCAVLGIEAERKGFRLRTERGEIVAGRVLVCTNAYTDGGLRYLRRRIVPVRSRIIVTEPLPAGVMAGLIPSGMMISETRELGYYYRPTPDGRRLLFGGRDGTTSGDPAGAIATLRAGLSQIFPQLDGAAISHSWFGNVAMHRDMIPRIFSNRGIDYATGFCGSGVVWAPWLGHHAAHAILGTDPEPSAFAFRPPRAVPLFDGRPWFMPVAMAWFRVQDAAHMRRNGR